MPAEIVGIAPLATELVYDWDALRNAVNDSSISEIIVQEDITLPAAATAITIPANRDVLIRSSSGNSYDLFRIAAGQRHFIVNGTLRLESIVLRGNYPAISLNNGGIIVNNGGRLYMGAGSSIVDNRNTSASQGGGVTVSGANASFTMNEGATIQGNNAGTGAGGVFVASGALFTMNGGTISNNSITGNTTAGVMVSGAGSEFVMNDGVIRNNTGRFGGGVRVGVVAASGALPPTPLTAPSMLMAGGNIHDNTALFGGAINVEWGLLTMEDGLIHDNVAISLGNPGTAAENTIQAQRGGGGVFVQNLGIFEMSGGTISNNESHHHGGGVMLLTGTAFNMSGGSIAHNTAANSGGGLAAALINASGNPVTGTITATMTNNELENGPVTSGTITSNTAHNDGGGVWLTPGNNTAGTGSQLVMDAGTISNNVAKNNGGGVALVGSTGATGSGSRFTMTSGVLEDGTATSGTITGNTTNNDGGGIWIGAGTGVIGARATIDAGSITNNTATFGHGGGIFTVAHNNYPVSLLATHYPNILAPTPFAVTFNGNSAGGGKFEPPLNPAARPFGNLLNNYDINYVGQNQLVLITFMLNGGNIAGNPASISSSVPLPPGTIDSSDIPSNPVKANHNFLGWLLRGDLTNTLLTAADIEDMTFATSTIFDAQWERLLDFTFVKTNELLYAYPAGSVREPLPGARFQLHRYEYIEGVGWDWVRQTINPNYSLPLDRYTVESALVTGEVALALGEHGEYKLVETLAPDGFRTPSEYGYWYIAVDSEGDVDFQVGSSDPADARIPAFLLLSINNYDDTWFLGNLPAQTIVPTGLQLSSSNKATLLIALSLLLFGGLVASKHGRLCWIEL